MSDKKRNNIDHADQNLLEQMVTEALMRDKMETPDVDMEWKRLAARMTAPSAEVKTTSRNEQLKVRFFSIRTLWMTIASVAAIAFIIFLISFKLDKATPGSLYEARKQSAEIVVLDEQDHEQVINGNEIKLASSVKVERHTVVVPEGKDMKLILADGTQVWLNANSRLIYPTAFKGKNREVELQGEGYFKVTHDAYHPFIVKAGDMQTSVLGTEFNVNAFDQSNPHVTLVEGSVKVSSVLTHKTETQVAGKIIVPGEDAVLNEQGKIIVSHVDTDDVACWKDGIQLFNDASLREIVLQLGSWYNVNVVCHDESLLNTHLRYMYNRRNGIEEAIKMLNDISNNKIKLKNNTILIE
ncbi:FecR family protein [Segatella copri]|jgi:hypothetical protein|uniref:FecR family protein n=1 Tax=Segatella copri TaxID=165179 RepID=A0A3E5DYH3_9BACT|nr:FecR family protein [Segatella copri]MEE1344682.1 FecR domain-containing protein [Segatella copri]MEE1461024.1 FecR domain-containing protein [Segatella copri]RGN81563.1 FecR family protein [Segatella copri]RGS13369.1 FecR family protein [Segatella copri]